MTYDELVLARSQRVPTHRIADALRGADSCPECGVPYVASIAIYDLEDREDRPDPDEEAASHIRLALGERVGERGMERWLECRCSGVDA